MNAVQSGPRRAAVVLLASAATIALLTECGRPGGDQTGATQAGPSRSPASAAMKPGMVMPDGSTMGADRAHSRANMEAEAKPTHTATMVCGAEIRHDIVAVLKLHRVPVGSARWANGTYTCTYRLPIGPLVLSVHEARRPALAQRYTDSLRHSTPGAERLDGLTQTAFGTTAGTVVLVKDADTLTVDATRLPAQFGGEHQKRSDFAYELASDILGCWTGDDS